VKPKQFFFVLLGLTVAVAALACSGYYFAMKKMQSDSRVLSGELADQTAADNQIDSLDHLQYLYNTEIVPILPLMDEALPRDKKQTEILAQLQNIATNAGLNITSISMPSPTGLPTSVSQTQKVGDVLALPISFQLSGTYDQLQTFTQNVEALNRFTNITNLAVSHTDKTKPIIYSISLDAYRLP